MKVKVLFAALASLVLASCTNNEQLLDETKKGTEIRFAVASQTSQTRAAAASDGDDQEHGTGATYGGSVYIWAWIKGTNIAIINKDVFNAQTGTFSDKKTYYYPTDGRMVDFLAIPVNVFDNGYVENVERSATGNTNVNFVAEHTTHNEVSHNTDIMTSEIITQKSGTVTLILRHLTTKLNVTIEQTERYNDDAIWSVVLNEMKITGIKNSGNFQLNGTWNAINGGNDCFWTSINNTTCDWTLAENHTLATHDLEENYKDIELLNYYVLPQTLVDGGQKLVISYSIVTKFRNGLQENTTANYTKVIEMKDIAGVSSWAMNKNITYLIRFNPLEELNKIGFSVHEEYWGDLSNGEGTEITPGNSEQAVVSKD